MQNNNANIPCITINDAIGLQQSVQQNVLDSWQLQETIAWMLSNSGYGINREKLSAITAWDIMSKPPIAIKEILEGISLSN